MCTQNKNCGNKPVINANGSFIIIILFILMAIILGGRFL